MKYIKLFEEMELIQRDDAQSTEPAQTFNVGDTVESYRGKGKIVEIDNRVP